MIKIKWTERLRCPQCAKTGTVKLYEISPYNNGVRHISDGFKVVAVEYGDDFQCVTCAISVAH
jgi:hypothetical protein